MSPTLKTRMPDRFEVVNGQVVEVSDRGAFCSEVANRIRNELWLFGRDSGLGRSRSGMLFHIPTKADPTRCRIPSVTFTSLARWPDDRPLPYRRDSADVIPDLVVEVASPNDEAEELLAKAHEYLEAGARLVWLVYPRLRVLHAYQSPTSPRVFTAADDLEGGDVLPGFRVPMAQLFPPMIPEPPSESDEAD